MTTDKLLEIIKRKNDDSECELANEARRIIDEIAHRQQQKVAIDGEIVRLREELKKLQADKLDASTILGEP